MNLLTIIQKVCTRSGLPIPASAVGSTDIRVLQMIGLLEEEGNDLSSRHDWSNLTIEASLTTTATEDQGSIDTICPTGFRYIRNNTIWDRTDQLPIWGPLEGQEWQALKAISNVGPRYRYRIRGNHLLSNPAPPAGHSWKFEYQSKNWVYDVDSTLSKEFVSKDTDTFLVPDHLVLLGLRWRWMKEEGLAYAELFNSYEIQVKDAMGRDGGAKRLSMEGRRTNVQPGVFINPMSWPLP